MIYKQLINQNSTPIHAVVSIDISLYLIDYYAMVHPPVEIHQGNETLNKYFVDQRAP
jgi:hypothetical protein